MNNEYSINDLSDKIFKSRPQPAKTYSLSFENNCMKEVFEALLMFLINGMKYLYGDVNGNVNIMDFSEEQIEMLHKYINSIGFQLTISEYDENTWITCIFPYFIQFNNMEYDDSIKDISIYQYSVSRPNYNKHYIISFTIL